jgi:hypothetical protein
MRRSLHQRAPRGWRNGKHAGQWAATLATYAYPIIGALPVQAVETALVLKGAGTALDGKARNGKPLARASRKRFGLR